MKRFAPVFGVSVVAAALVLSTPAAAESQESAPATEKGAPAAPSANAEATGDRAKETRDRVPAPVVQTEQQSDRALDAASRFFWEAHEEYQRGNYAAASALFERSYALAPERETLYNIALASANHGDCDKARAKFDDFAKSMAAEERGGLDAKAERIQELCPAPTVEAEPVVVAPEPPVSTNDTARPEAQPPAASAKPAAPMRRTVEPESQHAPLADRGEPTPSWTPAKVFGWSLLGSAVVATGAAAYFDTERREAQSDVDELKRLEREGRAPDNAADRLYERERDQGQARWAALSASIGATGFLLTGVSLLLLEGDDAEDGVKLSLDWRGATRFGVSGKF